MKTSIYSAQYDKLRSWLKTARQKRNLSLRDVSAITGTEFSIYGKIEQGRRRIDVVEFVEYCRVLDIDPHEGLTEIINLLQNPQFNQKKQSDIEER